MILLIIPLSLALLYISYQLFDSNDSLEILFAIFGIVIASLGLTIVLAELKVINP